MAESNRTKKQYISENAEKFHDWLSGVENVTNLAKAAELNRITLYVSGTSKNNSPKNITVETLSRIASGLGIKEKDSIRKLIKKMGIEIPESFNNFDDAKLVEAIFNRPEKYVTTSEKPEQIKPAKKRENINIGEVDSFEELYDKIIEDNKKIPLKIRMNEINIFKNGNDEINLSVITNPEPDHLNNYTHKIIISLKDKDGVIILYSKIFDEYYSKKQYTNRLEDLATYTSNLLSDIYQQNDNDLNTVTNKLISTISIKTLEK